MSKIEELARAAYEADPYATGQPNTFFSWGEADWAHASMEKRVRAVLTTLRTPSEEMVEAAMSANWLRSDHPPSALDPHYFAQSFTAAIDSLLKGEGE